jgi:hypothetical protein
MGDTIKKKQKFLRKEIIEKNYSGEEFAGFLESKKQGGSDVNSWSYKDLTQMVGEFQSAFQPTFTPKTSGMARGNTQSRSTTKNSNTRDSGQPQIQP